MTLVVPDLPTLLAFPTRDQVRTKLLSYWQASEIPITDWEPGAVMRALLELTAIGLVDVGGAAIPQIVQGGYPAVTTLTAADWITLVADQWFNLTRIPATATQQTVVLTRASGGGAAITISAGLLVYATGTGNQYAAITGGSLASPGTLTITVQAIGTNDSVNGINYVDPANTIQNLVTPIPLVTCNNPPPNFSAVTPTPNPATGHGVVTVSGTPATNPSTYDVLVSTSGQRAAAQIQTRMNGSAWSAPTTAGASFTFSSPPGPTVNFTDAADLTNPSFVAGDLYSFTSPGSPITSPGLDQETITALLVRCLARFPSLMAGAAKEKRFLWAQAASALVTRARAAPDPAHPGRVLLYIAGITNPITAAVSPVQTYIDQHEGIGARTTVSAASVQGIAATGNVTVSALLKSAVQAAAQAAWVAYVIGTDIGGVVRLAELEQAIMDAGALDVSALALTGGSPNIQLSPGSVASPGDITSTLVWTGI